MRRICLVAGLVGSLTAFAAAQASAASIGVVPDGGCLSYAGVYFCDADVRPTGTGVFEPFLRTSRDNKSKDGTPSTYSSGWNSDGAPLPESNDAKDNNQWNHSLTPSDIAVVNSGLPTDVAAGSYRLFTVDINQQGAPTDASSLISLVHFELYNCATPTYTALSQCSSFLNLFPNGTWVDFNYHNNNEAGGGDGTGSGDGDIDVYVPDNGFLGAYIALQDGWGTGGPDGGGSYADNDGYQEWASRVGPTGTTTGGQTTTAGGTTTGSIPEPATLSIMGLALAAVGYRMRRRSA